MPSSEGRLFTCTTYHLSNNAIVRRTLRPTPIIVISELGWFSDKNTFRTIVLAQPIPAMQDANDEKGIFKAWVRNIIDVLNTNYAGDWQYNEGSW